MNLSEASILVTGAARGIGNHLALSLAKEAKQVIIIDNNEALLAELPLNENVHAYHCDVTDPTQVSETITRIFEQHGGINVLINNAGIIHSEPLINFLSPGDKKHNLERWQKVIDVNLNSVFYVTANVIEQMVNRKVKGVIVNISSIAAQGNIGQTAYAATKAAVEAMTKTWSKELGMFKIRSTCIAPGFFDTPSTRESLNESTLKKWEKSVPVNRLGQLEELCSAVTFIIQNEYFNGKILPIDGGLNL